MIAKSIAPVIPVRVFGTYEAYGRHHTVPRPKCVKVKFRGPLAFKELRTEANDCTSVRRREIYQKLSEELMATIASLEPKTD